MTMIPQRKLVRIGYVGGQAKRVNERAIDGEWVACLGEYAEVVSIPPLSFMKLFGGSIERWKRLLPDSIGNLAQGLVALCERYRIEVMYVNLPIIMPYLMMARNEAGLKLTFICIAHSVGSEFWLKHWIGTAPLITDRDVLLVSSSSSLQALLHIAPTYRHAKLIPLCIRQREDLDDKALELRFERDSEGLRVTRNLLSIGRIESVKNIHILLPCFATMLKRAREQGVKLHLYVAGEYTGSSPEVVAAYRDRIEALIQRLELQGDVTFTGPVTGQVKDRLFNEAHLLINLSTDLGETFGYNLLEAKTWGLPVVCTAWDGFRDIVADGEEGTLVECRWDDDRPVFDEEEVSRACIHLLTQEERWRQYSFNTRRNAEHFIPQRVMPPIIEAVEHALNKPVQQTATYGWRNNCFEETIRSLSDVYHIPHLERLPFLDQSPATILAMEDSHSSEWTSWVKPIIAHYGRRMHDAKL